MRRPPAPRLCRRRDDADSLLVLATLPTHFVVVTGRWAWPVSQRYDTSLSCAVASVWIAAIRPYVSTNELTICSPKRNRLR